MEISYLQGVEEDDGVATSAASGGSEQVPAAGSEGVTLDPIELCGPWAPWAREVRVQQTGVCPVSANHG